VPAAGRGQAARRIAHPGLRPGNDEPACDLPATQGSDHRPGARRLCQEGGPAAAAGSREAGWRVTAAAVPELAPGPQAGRVADRTLAVPDRVPALLHPHQPVAVSPVGRPRTGDQSSAGPGAAPLPAFRWVHTGPGPSRLRDPRARGGLWGRPGASLGSAVGLPALARCRTRTAVHGRPLPVLVALPAARAGDHPTGRSARPVGPHATEGSAGIVGNAGAGSGRLSSGRAGRQRS
jgi:hypothetical protein